MKYDFRPSIHFTPPKSWANDPNGMVYIDGNYHFFYQHRPNSCFFPPERSEYKMHWGHAVSTDLIHWQNLPIALFPDEKGDCWSGSCVLDTENVSGLAINNKPPLIALYTNYVANSGTQEQSLAYSTDYVNFIKYANNPVMPNPGQSDYRDPKVFYNLVRKCYSLVITGGTAIEFYASKDLVNWEKTGEFEAAKYGIYGICECPDCFPISTDDGEKWVLVSSVKVPWDNVRKECNCFDRTAYLVQYFVGDFDGDKFINTQENKTPLLVDYGVDFYGAVTYQNTNDRIITGWAANWEYAWCVPTEDIGYRGTYTLARKLGLVKTDNGYRLSSAFVGLEEYKANAKALKTGENLLDTATFGIEVKGEGVIRFENSTGERIEIRITEKEITVDRRNAGLKDFSQSYALDCVSVSSAPILSEHHFDIVFDKSILEVIGDNGLAAITSNVYPTMPYDKINISGEACVKIYKIL